MRQQGSQGQVGLYSASSIAEVKNQGLGESVSYPRLPICSIASESLRKSDSDSVLYKKRVSGMKPRIVQKVSCLQALETDYRKNKPKVSKRSSKNQRVVWITPCHRRRKGMK